LAFQYLTATTISWRRVPLCEKEAEGLKRISIPAGWTAWLAKRKGAALKRAVYAYRVSSNAPAGIRHVSLAYIRGVRVAFPPLVARVPPALAEASSDAALPRGLALNFARDAYARYGHCVWVGLFTSSLSQNEMGHRVICGGMKNAAPSWRWLAGDALIQQQ